MEYRTLHYIKVYVNCGNFRFYDQIAQTDKNFMYVHMIWNSPINIFLKFPWNVAFCFFKNLYSSLPICSAAAGPAFQQYADPDPSSRMTRRMRIWILQGRRSIYDVLH